MGKLIKGGIVTVAVIGVQTAAGVVVVVGTLAGVCYCINKIEEKTGRSITDIGKSRCQDH